ncbi:MAG: hypothetical protein IPL15_23350 [Comamonadaceae bacterium]|uniref:hypothetical protein n=1 Tax=Candidatus Skiveiella danica TaxID=3386177 RepID=UPI00390AFA27|nr:hypothetical protein [Comamonadaceae bacterium]
MASFMRRLTTSGVTPKGSGHILDRLALPDQLGKGDVLVGRVHGDVEEVLRQAGDQRPVGRYDQHGHGVVVGEVAVAHQQGQRVEPTTARADLVAAACASARQRGSATRRIP